jgi:hypothetical protein
MHEPSSRPFARREHNILGWKTVSVEGKEQGFKVSGFQSFNGPRFQGLPWARSSTLEAKLLRAPGFGLCNLETLKP